MGAGMKAIRVFQCSVLCVSALLFAAQGSLAQDVQKSGEPEKIRIGDQEYTRGEIIADFLDVAFSDAIWNEDTGEDFKVFLDHFSKNPPARQESVKSDYPWLYDYIFYPEGWPKHDVINKWTGGISIGIGWPPYLSEKSILAYKDNPEGIHSRLLGLQKSFPEMYPVIEDQIKTLMPDIESATGMPVQYIPRDDPREMIDGQHARVRIIPIWSTNLKNSFKTLRWGPLDPSPSVGILYQYYEWILWGAVPFSPDFRSQVDGYLLPNDDNSIGLVVCKVLPDVGEDLLRSLITECLARAMGLPDVSKIETAALGHWNESYDSISRLPSLDGRKASISYDFGMGNPGQEKFVVKEKSDGRALRALTAYDDLMLSLLYCPAIRNGMDKHEVMRILMSDDECFRTKTQLNT